MPGEKNKQGLRLSRAETFEVLGNPYRLALLECLGRYDRPPSLSELSRALVGEVDPALVADDDEEAAQYLRRMLYHNHLPRLQQKRIIKESSPRNRVELSEEGEQLVRYLRRFNEILQ